jgi:hypothetical protein
VCTAGLSLQSIIHSLLAGPALHSQLSIRLPLHCNALQLHCTTLHCTAAGNSSLSAFELFRFGQSLSQRRPNSLVLALLHYTALPCAALPCQLAGGCRTVVSCTTLHCPALPSFRSGPCTSLHCPALLNTALHCTALPSHLMAGHGLGTNV